MYHQGTIKYVAKDRKQIGSSRKSCFCCVKHLMKAQLSEIRVMVAKWQLSYIRIKILFLWIENKRENLVILLKS